MSNLFNQINNLDLNSILNSFGLFGRKGNNYTIYYSPFRQEKHPSFSVYLWQGKYRWMDNGTRENGGVVDFLLSYCNLSPAQLKQKIENEEISFSSFEKQTFNKEIACQKEKDSTAYSHESRSLSNKSLLTYLSERAITDRAIIAQFLKEINVRYSNGRSYFMIGFHNDNGGYAVRNKYFKGNIGASGTTIIRRFAGLQKILVVEGFMDAISLLSCQKLYPQKLPEATRNTDILVLNSTVNLPHAEEIISKYSTIVAMLDNDKSGIETASKLKKLATQYIDTSSLYQHHKDLNEWWQNEIKLSPKLQKKRGMKY